MHFSFFFFFYSFEQSSTDAADNERWSLGSLVLSKQFMYDFFASSFHRRLRRGGTLSFHFLRTIHFRCCCCCCCCVEKVRLEAYLSLLYSTGCGYEIYFVDRCLFPDLFCRWLWYPFIINLPRCPGLSYHLALDTPLCIPSLFLFPGIVATRYSKFIVNAVCVIYVIESSVLELAMFYYSMSVIRSNFIA